MATKIGTDAWAIPAMLESMCVSPHATSVIGTAAFTMPRTRHGTQARRSSASADAAPVRCTRYAVSSTAAIRSLRSVIAAGGMSSTATLMKRYDAPHIDARSTIRGQYDRIV